MLPARAPGVSRRRHARDLVMGPDEFGVVLALILVTITVFAAVEGPFGKLISVALSGGTLLFVLHTAQASRRTFRVAAVVVTVAVLGAAGAMLFGDTAATSAAGLVGLLLAVLAPLVILRRIVLSPRITFRLVLGALAIYLLLGLIYAYLFPLVSSIDRHAVLRPDGGPSLRRVPVLQLHDAGHRGLRGLHGGDKPGPDDRHLRGAGRPALPRFRRRPAGRQHRSTDATSFAP